VRTRVLGAAVGLACLLVVGVSAGAWAGVTHPLSGTFGTFSSPGSVAVDQASGDVLVLDRGANQVLRFDSAGNAVNFAALGSSVLDGSATPQGGFAFDSSPGAAQVAVDNSGGTTDGDVYVTDSFHNVVDVFASDGSYLGQLTSSAHTGGFGEACGVAVDKTGAVYVAETNGWVHRYSAFSNPVSDADLSSEFQPSVCNLAVDSAGNVYGTQSFSAVNKYSPAGDFQYTVDANSPVGVAVDPATDNVYVAEGSQVAQYDASSSLGAVLLGTFGNGQVGSPAGVAVNGATNEAYVSDASANDVAIFGAAIPTPDATTDTASSVTGTAATLNGTVNPQGTATSWQFQYGTDTTYGSTAPASPGDAGSGSADVPVTTGLTGLSAATTYHYRLVATGTNGTTFGADQSFTTQAPPSIESQSVPTFGKTSATVEAQINPWGLDTTYHVEYNTADTSTAPDNTSTPDAGISAGFGDQQVDIDLSGLQPGTTYHYRFVASNLLGTVDGPDQQLTTQPVLSVDREYVTGLGISTATLNADINPLGDDTTYHFEYGTDTSYGTNVPIPDGDASAGSSDTTVSRPLTGLKADTVYHYRLVATNSVGTIQGPDHAFRTRANAGAVADSCPNAAIRATQQSAFLPDCRAYEMVSPPEKNGGDVSAMPSRTRAAVNGNAVQYLSLAGFGDVPGTNGLGTEYIAERGSDGWTTHGIDPVTEPPAFAVWNSRYNGDFSPDLNTGIFFALSPVTNEDPNVAQVRNLYLRRNLLTAGTGSYQLLTGCPACTGLLAPPPGFFGVRFDPALAGTSDDFRHVIFESPLNLTSEATGTDPKLYESVDGAVRLVGMIPASGETQCTGSQCTPAMGSIAGLGALNVDRADAGQYTPRTISADGSRIIFTAGPFTSPSSIDPLDTIHGRAGDLYLRLQGTWTIQLNVSERTQCADQAPCDPSVPAPDPVGHQPAMYGGASRDGSTVYFMTTEKLTDDVTSNAINLYRYDLDAPAGHHLTWISRPDADLPSGTRNATYVNGVSDDGSYVYFWGGEQLRDDQLTVPPAGEALYVWHDGVVRPIAVEGLPADSSNWGQGGLANGSFPYQVRVTPDGRHAVFVTRNPAVAQSVGFDNHNVSCGSDGFCAEAYLYNADADRLTCVSCDPGGGQPSGNASIASNSDDPTLLTVTQHLSHALSDDGSRVFFDSPDALVPQDTNGKRDVYEYDATSGRVSLISSGRSPSDSFFVEATPSGSDVYFTTRDQLVGIDRDQHTDLYDARVDGGTAAQSPAPQVSCSGVACHGTGSTAPSAPVLATVSFSGSGNVRAAGRVRVVRRAVHGSVLVLAVRVPTGGRLTVRGSSVGGASRSVSKAGTYTLRVRLTMHARRVLRHRHVLRVRLRVAYRPAGGSLSSVSIVVRVKA
jgi:hypothetical protein